MPADPRGGWFRIYSRQVLHHDKFRALSHAELGAWLDLRAAVDMLGGLPLPDRTEAMLRLRRRTRNPGKMLDRLIEVRLLDVDPDGAIGIHDLDEHDRRYPSDDPGRIRERVTRHRSKRNEDGTSGNGVTNEDETKPTRARADTDSEAEVDTEADTDGAARLLGLNGEDDPLTVICSLVLSAAPIEDADYRAKVDGQVRRFGKEWVNAAYRQAYKDIVDSGKRPRQWDLSRFAEVHLAGWTRSEELRQVEEQERREAEERQQQQAVELPPEERERQSLMRRAVRAWISGGRKGKVPEQVDELRSWLEQNEANGAPA
jgi:hypothetical protein